MWFIYVGHWFIDLIVQNITSHHLVQADDYKWSYSGQSEIFCLESNDIAKEQWTGVAYLSGIYVFWFFFFNLKVLLAQAIVWHA